MVFDFVEAVADVVVRLSFCLGNSFFRCTTGTFLAHLLTHDVNNAFCHEAVGRELTAGNRQDAIDAVAVEVVDNMHSTCHVAGIRFGDTTVLNQRPRTCPCVKSARLTEARNQCFTSIEHLLNLVGKNRKFIRIFSFKVRRTNDAHRVNRNQDVAICGPDTTVNDRLREAVIHCNHDAGAGDNLNAMTVSKSSDLSCPGTAAVQNEGAIDTDVFTASFIARKNRFNAILRSLNSGCPRVGKDLSTVGNSGASCAPRHTPTVNGSIFNREGPLEVGVQSRFTAQGLGGGNLFGGNASRPSALEEVVGVFLIICRCRDEKAACPFNGIGINTRDNCVLFSAFSRRFRVGCDIASTGVEQAVVAT